jgi:hypothetical protein
MYQYPTPYTLQRVQTHDPNVETMTATLHKCRAGPKARARAGQGFGLGPQAWFFYLFGKSLPEPDFTNEAPRPTKSPCPKFKVRAPPEPALFRTDPALTKCVPVPSFYNQAWSWRTLPQICPLPFESSIFQGGIVEWVSKSVSLFVFISNKIK